MDQIFDLIYRSLKWLSAQTGLTYEEINVVVYYIVVPALFVLIIGRILKKKILIISFSIAIITGLLIIPDFEKFSFRFFNASVNFLKSFETIGLSYIQASVIICVFAPIIFLLFLLFLKKKSNIRFK